MFERIKQLLRASEPAEPEPPCAFGYKIDWLALESEAPRDVIRELQRVDSSLAKREARACSWSHGIERAYQRGRCFVTPPVEGWVLTPGYRPGPKLDTVLRELSRVLDTRVCHFGNLRTVSYVGYGLADRGELLRLYNHVDGETAFDIGAPTADEVALELRFWDELEDSVSSEDEDALFMALPDEATVHELAARWSVNPNAEDWAERAPGVGWLL